MWAAETLNKVRRYLQVSINHTVYIQQQMISAAGIDGGVVSEVEAVILPELDVIDLELKNFAAQLGGIRQADVLVYGAGGKATDFKIRRTELVRRLQLALDLDPHQLGGNQNQMLMRS
jgi:hypothetical protein